MDKIAIVVVAYNRDKSLKRLLESLSKAKYNKRNIPLIISIDKSDNELVLECAEHFVWNYGKKIIINHSCNLGLRSHILKCGELTNEYENIILLEDDLYVSMNFYKYAEMAMQFYKNENNIAGISLYSQRINETAKLPFEPLKSKGDVFFMQIASSWGQCWSKKQWNDFIKWYKEHVSDDLLKNENIPYNVASWPETSWKKYFIYYLITMKKYFVYPYFSLTTNCGDEGVHFKSKTNIVQVPLRYDDKEDYEFVTLNESKSVYDAFCENITVKDRFISLIGQEIVLDIYGVKKIFHGKYLISTQKLDYKILESFKLSFKPCEANIIENLIGNDIFLYDLSTTEKNNYQKVDLHEYFYETLSRKRILINYFKKLFKNFLELIKQKINPQIR